MAGDPFPSPRSWPPATFRALRHPNYQLYFFAQLISLTGSWVQSTALTWLAYEWTSTSTWPALVGAAQIMPMAVLSFLGGAMADRWPRRVIIFAAQCGQLVQSLLLVALVLVGPRDPWALLGISLLLGLVNAIDTPARMAFVIDLVGREDLANAVALNSMTFNLARLIGPAVCGPLLAWAGPAGCFGLNAATFAPVLLALALMRLPLQARRTAPDTSGSLAFLAARPRLILLLVLAGGMSLFGWPLLSLLPALADQRLGASKDGYAYLLGSVGGGSLVGALIVATFTSGRGRSWLLCGGVVLAAAALLGLSQADTLRAGMGWCGLSGLGLILFFATGQGAMQLGADEHNRGKVLGVWLMVLASAHPLGHLLAGRLADHWGVSPVIAWQAAGIAATTLGAALAWALLPGRPRDAPAAG